MSPYPPRRPRVSVVIPTYDRADALRRTLESLADQTLDVEDYEVVVADDGSSDHTADVVASFEPRLRIARTWQEDRGYRVSAARNAGARRASAPVLVFLDSGTLAGRSLLAEHLRVHDEADGPVALTGYTYGYRPYDLSSSLALALRECPPEQVVAEHGGDPDLRDLRHDRWAELGFDLTGLRLPWLFFWSMNVSVRTDDYWAVGGFDEGFVSWGVEDQDLGYRLARHGARFAVSRTAWAVEPPHPRDIEANLASGKRNTRQFFEKYRDPVLELEHAMLEEDLMWETELEAEALARWTRDAAGTEPGADEAVALAAVRAGRRVAVLGIGRDVPPELREHVLVDVDADRVRAARRAGARDVRHSVGVHTGLADGEVDLVVVTARWAGLMPRWGARVLAEARRAGAEVYVSDALRVPAT
ncbi:hypothetical protein Cch01nite_13180 [Cellulomonas chitinilytica]|uniref:Glycosyltransferase n=1 Tax=Cellulomonas chitinilytica TaxID=398759 RepID=A0A919P3V7_9CELL|nr:glycosyltransferase [Cellulomonas chitinilytica]GIG20594.1 hypothetical protein Cch01nite_13180 [Cellulomonas chitinilytica]